MSNTKEEILLVALRLFAKEGYEAVSVSQISSELGIAKSALYKHYKNKRDIFDHIVDKMNRMNHERVQNYKMPEEAMDTMTDVYRFTPLEQIRIYSEAQFRYWTEENFSLLFRKMLTLEQYRSKEMAELYQHYFVVGPFGYIENLFRSLAGCPADAKQLALEFYAPVYLLYSLYDNAEEKEKITEMLRNHIKRFFEKLESIKD